MKFLCRAFCVLFVAVCAVRAVAQDEDPETFGDYAPTEDDDLIEYVPKNTVRLGFRSLSGAKTSFGGAGHLSSGDYTGDDWSVVKPRGYHDGAVASDTRTVVDPSGRTVPITPDGRTNTWGFADQSQATEDGLIMMHGYTADVIDSTMHERSVSRANGLELSLDRELGKLFRTQLRWGFVAGMSMNQFNSRAEEYTNARITTVTDYYSLGGQTAPTAPYTAPVANGAADASVLLGTQVLFRDTTISTSPNSVTTDWHVRGAYMTFRAGPTLLVPIGRRFSASFSVGGVLVYAGSTYEVRQVFRPETGDDITQINRDGVSSFLPGFYVDASVQWEMTETAGLYLGGVYQNSGSYTQEVVSEDGKSTYNTRIDLSSLQGVRAGVSFKF